MSKRCPGRLSDRSRESIKRGRYLTSPELPKNAAHSHNPIEKLCSRLKGFMPHISFCVGLILTFTSVVTGQTSSGVVEVSGVVLNTSEEVIPGASVTLRRNDVSKPPTVVTSDARGSFRFSRLA